MTFSTPDSKFYRITPLGAALVEAMPNRKLMNTIKREFKKTGKCPLSAIFPTQISIDEFYKEHHVRPD